MKTFAPATGSEHEWNEACSRLEDYLRALRLVNKPHQNRIILELLDAAAARHAANPDQSPTAAAMDEARAVIDRWFAAILSPREQPAVTGFVSLLAADVPQKWPASFLAADLAPELPCALRQFDVRSSPGLQVTSMVPRPVKVRPLLDAVDLSGLWRMVARALTTTAMAVSSLGFSELLRLSTGWPG